MKGHIKNTYTAVIEKCPDTGLFVRYIPGIPGAHSQGATMEEIQKNLQEVLEMLLNIFFTPTSYEP